MFGYCFDCHLQGMKSDAVGPVESIWESVQGTHLTRNLRWSGMKQAAWRGLHWAASHGLCA